MTSLSEVEEKIAPSHLELNRRLGRVGKIAVVRKSNLTEPPSTRIGCAFVSDLSPAVE